MQHIPVDVEAVLQYNKLWLEQILDWVGLESKLHRDQKWCSMSEERLLVKRKQVQQNQKQLNLFLALNRREVSEPI